MRKYILSLAILLLGTSAHAACEIDPQKVAYLKPKLNSDRIEYFFGSYSIDALDIDSAIFPESRIANLHSVHEGKKIMRTLAIVDYFLPVQAELQEAHHEIVKGKSIGIALRDKGWTIHKAPVYFGNVESSKELMEWMDESTDSTLALHIYRLDVSKNGEETIPYCTIIELHSPQYLNSEWLEALNQDQYNLFSNPSSNGAILEKIAALIADWPAS